MRARAVSGCTPASRPDHHGAKQGERLEIGSQGLVSETLGGKRELNIRQVRALALRFGVTAATFV
jgi:HTH-type transcriptional regulator / antitoxin HigA